MATRSGPKNARTVSSKRLYEWRSQKALLADEPERFWSVTTILKGGIPSPALTYWAAKAVAEYATANHRQIAAMLGSVRLRRAADGTLSVVSDPDAVDAAIEWLKGSPWRERDRKADRGTAVHARIEAHILGRPLTPAGELTAFAEAFDDFVADFSPEFEAAEMTVYNRTEKYAGTLDFICTIPKLGRVLGDTKTSTGVYPETAQQLAAYRYAEFIGLPDGSEAPMPQVDGCVVLHLHPDAPDRDGRLYSLLPVIADEDVFKAFKYTREQFRWQEELSKGVIGEPLPVPGARAIATSDVVDQQQPSPAKPAKSRKGQEATGVFA
jgi:hypothetical protein